MGQECSACDAQSGDQQNELDYATENGPQNKVNQPGDINIKSQTVEDLAAITRVQAMVRRFLQRRKYLIKKNTYNRAIKYFKEEESKETLKGTFKDDGSLEKREYKYTTGAVYNGQWKGGLRHGQGTMQWADGAKYEGCWDLNQATNHGKFTHVDGGIYEGNWVNNKANGHGVYVIDGAKYDGPWKEDHREGEGVETWNDGSKYIGNYKESKKEGKGSYTWGDGSHYEGTWSADML